MVHGARREAAWSIAESGFGIAAQKDEGYFGKGFFFFLFFFFPLFYYFTLICNV
jgi:hypothetical protein